MKKRSQHSLLGSIDREAAELTEMWNLRLKRSKETGGGKEGDELDPLSLFLSLLPRRSNLPVDETRQAQPEYQEREARRDFHVEPLDCSLRKGTKSEVTPEDSVCLSRRSSLRSLLTPNSHPLPPYSSPSNSNIYIRISLYERWAKVEEPTSRATRSGPARGVERT